MTKLIACLLASLVPTTAVMASHPDDMAFLEDWQRRCFDYLWTQTNPATGMVADRAPVRMQLQLHKLLWGDTPGV